jgi:hypothetical protein
VFLWLGLAVVLKGEDAGAGGREGACDGRYADVVRRNGVSPLFVASQEGHASCVEALIHAKADLLQCAT